MPFSTFGLTKNILQSLKENNYEKPTQIQNEVIPLVLEGKDVIAMAQTGSGKSASFVLPILQSFSQNKAEGKSKIKALILTPTRELTVQVANAFVEFGKYLSKKPKVISVIGGESLGNQLYEIQQGCDILVATSGRFLDALSKKQMNLSYLEFFVLDEADKMLGIGFTQELNLILESIPSKRQNLMFSATYPVKMQELASKITTSAIQVNLEEATVVETVEQRAIEVSREDRGPLLRYLVEQYKYKLVLVFMANKRATDNIAVKFRRYGFEAASFNGDLEQESRNETLLAFKQTKINILFATDIAARGLDVKGIECVVNYDLPRSPADYVHRIGRTARAGKSGVAISFISYEDEEHFKLIEKRAGIKLVRESVKGFETEKIARVKTKGSAPVKGKGKSKKDKLRELNAAQEK